MISGATPDNGVALTPDGAMYVLGIASGSLVPAGTVQMPGTLPGGGKCVDSTGALCVRYV